MESTRILDCRGELCPLPVARARRALLQAEAHTPVEVWCTDPLAELDLQALCARESWHFHSSQRRDDGVQVIVLARRPSLSP